MRLVLALVVILLSCAAGGPATCFSAPRAASGNQSGGYINVSQWASRNGFDSRWLKPNESLELSRGATRIHLLADSRQAGIDGVSVWLLFPVIRKSGSLAVSERDAQATFTPILSPAKDPPGVRINSICIDPGHGGKDPGLRSGLSYEKTYTLLLAKEVRDQLSRAGFNVTLTRTSDRYVDLSGRPELAQRRKADLFISLHFNSVDSDQKTVQGAEVYCLTASGAPSSNSRPGAGGSGWSPGNRNDPRNLFLAYQLQKALVNELGVADRGVHRARFVVLREALMPAVLIEAGFLSHPSEGRKIKSASYRRQIARAIMEGVLVYQRRIESSSEKPSPSRSRLQSGKHHKSS